jgi:chromosome partitioning protein
MTIAISNQKGGVGKSTIAWNLAIALQKNHNIEIVDLDNQKTLTYANEIRKAGKKTKPLKIISMETSSELKAYFDNDNDERISIIDIGGFDSSMNRMAIIAADMIITPVSDKGFDILGIKSYEEVLLQLSKLIKETIVVQVLLNNINPKKSKLQGLREFLNKSDHFKLMDTVIRNRADYDRSASAGMNAIEYDKKSKAAKEIKALKKEVLYILKISN